MKRPFIIWLIFSIILTLCLLISGCKTGGRSLSTKGLEKGSDGIWRLKKPPSRVKPKEIDLKPQVPIIITNKVENIKIPPVPVKSVKSKPVIELKSAEANEVLDKEIKGVGDPTPFTPSIAPAPRLIEGDGGRVSESKNPPAEKESNSTSIKIQTQQGEDINVKKSSIKIPWIVLLLAFMMVAWIIYDLVKDILISKRHILNRKELEKAKAKKKSRPRKKKLS